VKRHEYPVKATIAGFLLAFDPVEFLTVLAGFLVPEGDEHAFHQFLEDTGYRFIDETDNDAYHAFLSAPEVIRTNGVKVATG
jgi:hypothetical protein